MKCDAWHTCVWSISTFVVRVILCKFVFVTWISICSTNYKLHNKLHIITLKVELGHYLFFVSSLQHILHDIQPSVSSHLCYRLGSEWVIDERKRRVLWVPPDLRHTSDSYEKKAVLGSDSGRLVFVDISYVQNWPSQTCFSKSLLQYRCVYSI